MNYRDRNGNTILNTTSRDKILNSLYSNEFGRLSLKILTLPAISNLLGSILSTKFSCVFIKPYIKYCKLNMHDYINEYYYSYNDFFTRRVKPEKRPIKMEDNILISPCDGKVSVYPISKDSTFTIKNSKYNVRSLLKDKKLAKKYEGGYCLIFRLSLEDYHRYCYIDRCKKSKNRRIKGILHTDNPVVYDHFEIYKENAREYCILNTENFGNVVQVEIGAMFVGKIVNYHETGCFERGREKGMFEFGGSTIVLLMEKDRVNIDHDLLNNTELYFETIVKMGEKIGTKI